MDRKAQSALEYLMTYGWALVVIAIIIAALVFLLGQSSTAQNCTMSPAAGGIGYVDHTVDADGNLTIRLRNDTGKTIQDVNATFTGDFDTAADQTAVCTACVSTKEFNVTGSGTGIVTGATYSGQVAIAYSRSGIRHTAVASCTGKSQ